MKILEYIIRFKNESKRGADEAKKEVESVGKTVEQQAATTVTATKAIGDAMREGTLRVLSLVPGGGLFSKLIGAAPSLAIGAVSVALLGLRKLVNMGADEFAKFSERLDEASTSFSKFASKTREGIKFTLSADGMIETIDAISDRLEQLRIRRKQIEDEATSKNPMNVFGIVRARGERGASDEDISQAERMLELAKERKRINMEGEAASARVEATSAARKERMAMVEAQRLKETLASGDYSRLIKLRDESGAAMIEIMRKGPGYGGGDATKEDNERLAKLSAAFESASDAIKRFDEEAQASADSIAESRNKNWKDVMELRGKLREERIGDLSPEKQLQARRMEYRAVVTEGRTLAGNDPRKVDLANRAMELRAIMRPLIESIASASSDSGDEDVGGSGGASVATRRTRRGPIGLGRLSGNRAGYRFGRILGSQFDGATIGGGATPPAKRPIEDIGEEQLRVLKNIEAKTGFGKGG